MGQSETEENVFSFSVILLFLLHSVYYATQRKRLQVDYFLSRPKDSIPLTQIGQIGLRYNTTGSGETVSFNQTSEVEKATRETSVVNFLKTLDQKVKLKQLPVDWNVTTVSNKKKPGTGDTQYLSEFRNTECVSAASVVENWWGSRYVAKSLFTREVPETRFLPMSFYMETVDRGGNKMVFSGAVKSLVVEADTNLLQSPTAELVSYKLYFTLVNTGWANHETESPGGVIEVVASQQSDRCVFTAVTRKGKLLDVFVSVFAFRLEPKVVSMEDDVASRFHADGEGVTLFPEASTSETGLATVRFHASRDRLINFMMRAMPLLDESIKSKRDKDDNNTILYHNQEAGALPLVLQLNTTDNELFPEAGTQSLSIPVQRVVMSFNAPPREAGDLDPDPASMKTIAFVGNVGAGPKDVANTTGPKDTKKSNIKGIVIVGQDTSGKNNWVFKNRGTDALLSKGTTIELGVLSRSPALAEIEPMARKTKITSEINGGYSITPTPSVRWGGKMTTVDKGTYDEVRTRLSWMDEHDLRTHEDTINFDCKDAMIKFKSFCIESSWETIASTVFPVLLAFVASWLVVGPGLFQAVVALASVVCAVTAVFTLGLWFGESRVAWDDFDAWGSYVEILMGAVIACVVLVCCVMLFSVRLSPVFPVSLVLGVVVIVLSSLSIYVYSSYEGGQSEHEDLMSFRLVSLVLLALALGWVTLVMNRMVRELGETTTELTLLPTSAPSATMLLLVFFIVGIVSIGGSLRTLDQCDDIRLRMREIERNQKKFEAESPSSESDAISLRQIYYDQEQQKLMEELRVCLDTSVSVPAGVGIKSFLVILASVFMFGTFLFSRWYQSRIEVGDGDDNEEDEETMKPPSRRSVVRSLIPFIVMGSVLYVGVSLFNTIELRTPECDALRTTMEINQYEYQNMTTIEEMMWRKGCSAKEDVSVTSVGVVLTGIALASFVGQSVTRKRLKRRVVGSVLGRVVFLGLFVGSLCCLARWFTMGDYKKDFLLQM